MDEELRHRLASKYIEEARKDIELYLYLLGRPADVRIEIKLKEVIM